jgi:arginyl-tRNA synthetase
MGLYVRFHDEAKNDPGLEDEARNWFKRLEDDDTEARELWQWFRDVSLEEFNRVYRVLGVSFDCVLGESHYRDQLKAVVTEALDRGIAVWEDLKDPQPEGTDEPVGSTRVAIIRLDDQGITTPLLLQKSDGASLYATRDIATAKYRTERWHPSLIVYVVGGEQQLYFRQCFAAFRKMGISTPCVHAWFGLIRLPEGKMSTRAGRVVLLQDLVDESIRRARDVLQDREMPEADKQRLAEVVGVGAIKYADLSQDRTKDVVFDWDRMLSLTGDSAPYIQYAHTRAVSILRKAAPQSHSLPETEPAGEFDTAEKQIIKTLARFPEMIEVAGADLAPHRLAGYLLDLAQVFSRFYRDVPVLRADDPKTVAFRLGLVDFARVVIRNGMALLGIECPDSM